MSGRATASPTASSSAEDAELSEGCVISTGGSTNGVRTRGRETAPEAAPRPGVGMALRLGADFVAGVVVGAALGWGFDALFGTSPWGLIVFSPSGVCRRHPQRDAYGRLDRQRPGLDDDPASRRFD